jgi:D-inositol-3-phosphate glycosyltransferase
VVAAAVGGLTTVVRDGVSGLLVDTHEPRDWAATLRRLIDDPALVEQLGKGAVAHAQEFSWDHTAERTLEAYARAAGRMRAEMAT